MLGRLVLLDNDCYDCPGPVRCRLCVLDVLVSVGVLAVWFRSLCLIVCLDVVVN